MDQSRASLTIVAGRPGSGKTTLAHTLARAIRCPAICRDEVKEGLVHSLTPGAAITSDEVQRQANRAFFRTVKEPALLAFSTASSEAALPDALQRMVNFGVPRRIVSFVMPAGYSFNLDGTTLYLSLTVMFVAQAAGMHLTLAQQVPILLTLMLTSKGAAGVPRAGLVVLSGTLTTFGLPMEGVAVVLGVEAFLDMARTSVNLLGNCVASVVMARWEGELTDMKLDGKASNSDG